MPATVDTDIAGLLGDRAEDLLGYEARGFSKEDLHLPGPDFVERVYATTDRSPVVLRALLPTRFTSTRKIS